MKLFKGLSKHDLLYGGLISTFVILYGATAFVSWYHAITFFNIANAMWLSVILSFVAEIGQASVLFSILLTTLKKFSHVVLSWTVMVLLTTLQVIGNVVSSYEWITTHGGAGVEAFQKSILFWMAAADPEIFKVVIAWITGALLPIIALSMTALVAQYMELRTENAKTKLDVDETKPLIPEPAPIPADVVMSEVSKIRLTDEEMENLAELLNKKKPIEKIPPEEEEKKTSHPLGFTDEDIKRVDEMKKKEWRVINNHLNPEHQIFVDELSKKNEDAITDSEPTYKSDIDPTQFKSPGIYTVEKEINHSPSIEEILDSLSPEAKQYMREKLDQEQKPSTSDEIHKEWTKMYDDIHELAEEEVPPPDQLTDQEVIPHYSDEEVREMFMDEWEKKGTYNDVLDEDAEELTPELSEEEIKKVVSEDDGPPIIVTHQSGLVDGILGSQPVEIPNSEIYDETGKSIGINGESGPPDPIGIDEKRKQEEARVEKLRQIARNNLKKK